MISALGLEGDTNRGRTQSSLVFFAPGDGDTIKVFGWG